MKCLWQLHTKLIEAAYIIRGGEMRRRWRSKWCFKHVTHGDTIDNGKTSFGYNSTLSLFTKNTAPATVLCGFDSILSCEVEILCVLAMDLTTCFVEERFSISFDGIGHVCNSMIQKCSDEEKKTKMFDNKNHSRTRASVFVTIQRDNKSHREKKHTHREREFFMLMHWCLKWHLIQKTVNVVGENPVWIETSGFHEQKSIRMVLFSVSFGACVPFGCGNTLA